MATNGEQKLIPQLPFALQWMWIGGRLGSHRNRERLTTCVGPLFVIASLAPESPWYLVRQGRYQRAEKVVKRLRTDCSDVEAKQAVALMVSLPVNHELEKVRSSCSDPHQSNRGVVTCGHKLLGMLHATPPSLPQDSRLLEGVLPWRRSSKD